MTDSLILVLDAMRPVWAVGCLLVLIVIGVAVVRSGGDL